MDVERLMMQAGSYSPFCPVRRPLYVIHGLRRGLCADRLGNTQSLRNGVVLILLL